ncbi:MAG: aldo/keto reductase, partial [Acidimicrobiales bacterium]
MRTWRSFRAVDLGAASWGAAESCGGQSDLPVRSVPGQRPSDRHRWIGRRHRTHRIVFVPWQPEDRPRSVRPSRRTPTTNDDDWGAIDMEYVKLGSTGLDVSRVCLGCMSYGEPGRGSHPWSLDEEASRPFIQRAVEAGINFFDTANVYSDGSSEEIVGRALNDYARREEIVIATKVHGAMNTGRPNGRGLSRKAIMTQIDASLRRLGTDYVDLYQIHRWDPHTPIEETLQALHDVVQAGKARYLGASSMYAWQFSKAL